MSALIFYLFGQAVRPPFVARQFILIAGIFPIFQIIVISECESFAVTLNNCSSYAIVIVVLDGNICTMYNVQCKNLIWQ